MLERATSRLPGWAPDVLLAVFITAMQLQGVVVRGPGAGERPVTDLAGLGAILLIVPGLALMARRRWPLRVFVIATLCSIAYYALDFSDGPGWLALFVALYSLTAHGDGRRSVRIAGVGIAILAVAWLVASRDVQPAAAIGWVYFRIGAAVMSAALGESVRARRDIALEALARADLAERTREEEARARVAQERLKIAREVHDTVAHAIAIINVQAGVTAHVLDKRPERARDTLLTIEQTSSRALEEMRTVLGMLRTDGEDSTDGHAPMPNLTEVAPLVARAREAGLDITLEESPAAPVPNAVGNAAYRIVQEAITNVIRHVGPTRVTVAMAYARDVLQVSVADDGPRNGTTVPTGGVSSGSRSGSGLRGMRERCELLGGRFEAGPRPDAGFCVRALLPVAPYEGTTE